MVATLAGEAGLKAKLIHFDNGWNTQKANKNIFQFVKSMALNLILELWTGKYLNHCKDPFFCLQFQI